MVDRDELPDGGASVMAATVRAIRARSPEIMSHNLETLRRLTPLVRSSYHAGEQYQSFRGELARLRAARGLRA